ncbi:kinase A anchor protein [Amylocarpus encephaloides]|uniref:Kinase A anchor protein n=1 Tax=Amylocarpus encephaloides TaxID=45428 RepID=A0A9P7YMK2_9HELO|nr:kinase A anchor protein [Amylocarpus encephaloides]
MSKPKLTHFLCIPLLTPTSTPQLRASLGHFRSKIANVRTAENPDGVPSAAIRPLGTLHLTLGVMSLQTREDLSFALDFLQRVDLKSLLAKAFASEPSPASHIEKKDKGKETENSPMNEDTLPGLRLTIKGLQSMHNPATSSILYAPPTPSTPLESFCKSLKERFVQDGLLEPDNRPLLLHATILNTIYVPGVRRGREAGHGKKSKSKLIINAKEILNDFEDFVWMEDVKIEKISMCRMRAEIVEDEELGKVYFEEGSRTMP